MHCLSSKLLSKLSLASFVLASLFFITPTAFASGQPQCSSRSFYDNVETAFNASYCMKNGFNCHPSVTGADNPPVVFNVNTYFVPCKQFTAPLYLGVKGSDGKMQYFESSNIKSNPSRSSCTISFVYQSVGSK